MMAKTFLASSTVRQKGIITLTLVKPMTLRTLTKALHSSLKAAM